MTQANLFYRFGIALVIGVMIGLERERAAASDDRQPQRELLAGVRTFALFGLAGCLATLVTDLLASPWPFVVVMIVLGLLIAAAHLVVAWRNEVGLTTEVAAIVTILAGALCYWDYIALATAIGVTTTLLLSLKLEMHRFAHQITQEDVYATLRFAVVTLVVLPVLPNRSFGSPPFDVLNPYRLWLMVVFISGISFLGYILIKLVDARRGLGLAALLGGLVSSTAVTLSFAERSRQQTTLTNTLAFGILLAWIVMFGRVLVEVFALNRALLAVVSIPLVSASGVALLYVGYLYWLRRIDQPETMRLTNPFRLGPALQFGLLYALILLVSRTAELYFGNPGIYLSSLIAGVADVDAITLSIAELSSQGGITLSVAARAIILAVMSNTLVKAGIVWVVGSGVLTRTLLPGVLLIAATGVGIAFFAI